MTVANLSLGYISDQFPYIFISSIIFAYLMALGFVNAFKNYWYDLHQGTEHVIIDDDPCKDDLNSETNLEDFMFIEY